MEKMRAVVYSKKVSPDKLIYSDIDKPIPKENELLIKVYSVALNAADYRSIKMGIIPKGKVFGADIAGVVESVGNSVTYFKPGDEVLGDLGSFGFGGLAEYVAAPESALIAKPKQIPFEHAAALPMASLTALQALRDKGKIKKGDKVLIVGSAGGVGTFAVQLARYFEADITGVCSTKSIQQTISLGADRVIDYTKVDFTKSEIRYNLILGINGNYPLLAYKRSLTRGGRYVMVGGSLSQIFKSLLLGWLLSFGSKKMKHIPAKANNVDLEFLIKLLENGKIKPVIDRRYSLGESVEAINYLSQGHATGKVVIKVAE
jgi:NADPH:quinone reductase-like Zn-dependent oxidoreductase